MNDVLAFGFATPWIAWAGVAAAAGPIVIHLLNRRRYRPVEWAAMRFLIDSHRRNRRRLRLEELLLLALRCLLVLLIAFAVARPQSTRPLLPVAGRATGDHCFILDDSASMGVRHGPDRTFDRAVADLADLVDRPATADRLAIYRTSDMGRPWRQLGRPTDREALAAQITQLPPADTRGGLAETLAAAAKALAESDYHKKVYLISDFRRVDLEGASGRQLRRQFARLGEIGAELVLIDHGRQVEGNLTVQQILLLDRHAIAGSVTRLAAVVANSGDAPADAGRLKVTAGDVALPVRDIPPIPAGQSRIVEFSCVFANPGPAVVEVRLPADALAADNAAHLALAVRRSLSVLIVDGQIEPDNPQQDESFYLRTALDPTEDGSYGLRPEVISSENVGNVDFDNYDLVVLAGVGELPGEVDQAGRLVYPTVKALERYVRRGGGLAIFSGERVNLDFYNQVLFAGGSGLCPLMLGPAVGDAHARQQHVTLRTDSIAGVQMLEIFRGSTAMLASLIRFYRYSPASVPDAMTHAPGVGPPRVLARYDDRRSSPAIVQQPFGDGAVMLFTSTAGARWNDWPKAITLTYLPVMNDMVAALARREGEKDLTDTVGHPIVLAPPDLLADTTAVIKTPDFPRTDLVQVPAETAAGRPQITYPRTRWAGTYELTYPSPAGPDKRLLLARNVDGDEGRLAKATREEIVALVGGLKATYVDRTAAGGDGDDAQPLREYWRWLLATALLTLALEVFLAQKFGHYPAAATGRAT